MQPLAGRDVVNDVGKGAGPRQICGAVALCAALVAQPLSGVAAAPRGHFIYVCLGEEVTAIGTSGADRIEGTKGRDVILGLGGDDVILGGDGRDLVCGGGGSDELQGRYGADLLDGGPGRDVLEGGPGGDLLLGGTGRDRLFGGDGGSGDTLVGGRGTDSLSGGDGRHDSDFLFGGPSGDFLDGGLGALDELYGGTGNDFLTGGLVSYEFAPGPVIAQTAPAAAPNASGEGDDRLSEVDGIVGSRHSDTLSGGDGAERFRGLGGDDRIEAGGGDDDVDGGPGSDVLEGGLGRDFLLYGDSSVGVTASLRDGAAQDDGTDTLTGFESLSGSYFDDTLTGDDGPNLITGSFGSNTLLGLAGDDSLDRASGGDAGVGSDTCDLADEVTGCEGHIISEYEAFPYVAAPVHRQAIDHLGTVRGGIEPGFGGPPSRRIEVGIRRMTSEGCSWWSARESRFERGTCGTVRGEDLRWRNGKWALRIDASLRAGTYLVVVQWPGTATVSCKGVHRPSCVSFDVR